MGNKKSLNHDLQNLPDYHDSNNKEQSSKSLNHKNQGADKWNIPSDWEVKIINK